MTAAKRPVRARRWRAQPVGARAWLALIALATFGPAIASGCSSSGGKDQQGSAGDDASLASGPPGSGTAAAIPAADVEASAAPPDAATGPAVANGQGASSAQEASLPSTAGGVADAATADRPMPARDLDGQTEATTATAPDATHPDAAAPPTIGGCAGVFCEDFERGALDPMVWTTQYNGGQGVPVVQAVTVAHGKYAVQFHALPNVVSYDFIVAKNVPAALRAHHFGRAYFNVTPKPPAQHTAFLFAGTPGFPKLKYLEVAGIGTAWQLTFVDLIAGGESYASGGNAPDARWICLEWEFNDAPDQAAVFVDGAPSFARTAITMNGVSTGLVGGFTDVGFGFYAWHPATYAFDIYYDDIVLDTKRVGCLP